MTWCEYTGNCHLAKEFIDESFEFYLNENKTELKITNISFKAKCYNNNETCPIKRSKLNLEGIL